LLQSKTFIIYVNELSPTIKYQFLIRPIIFAYDTSVIISSKKSGDFCRMSNVVLSHKIKWFAANRLALNLDRKKIMKCVTNNSPQLALNTGYNRKYVEESVNMKSLGLQTDKHLNLTNHIDKLIPKLGKHVLQLGLCAISSTLILSKQLTLPVFTLQCNFWATHLTAERYSLYKKKLLD
jgi:hypothetical protein